MPRSAFPFTEAYYRFDYGPTHPLKISRLKLTRALMDAYGLLDLPHCRYVETRPARPEDLLSFHDEAYVRFLERIAQGDRVRHGTRFGIGPGDNPPFPGLLGWSLLTTGATLQCADLVAAGDAGVAFNMAGGLHHAARNRASGFCYINDPVLGILRLRARGLRVVYIDVDAHHGDGVQNAFFDDPHVLTVSFHQDGTTLFPGTGFPSEMGRGAGRGFSVNVPLPPHTDDEVFLLAFETLVPRLVECFEPDVLVSQLGVDTFHTDPLASLDLTTNAFCRVVSLLRGFEIPWVALGGGGYHTANVARAWTLAWAIMNDVELPRDLPHELLRDFQAEGYHRSALRDDPFRSPPGMRAACRREVEQSISFVREHILPCIRAYRHTPDDRKRKI